jgi:hypothetical protein
MILMQVRFIRALMRLVCTGVTRVRQRHAERIQDSD